MGNPKIVSQNSFVMCGVYTVWDLCPVFGAGLEPPEPSTENKLFHFSRFSTMIGQFFVLNPIIKIFHPFGVCFGTFGAGLGLVQNQDKSVNKRRLGSSVVFDWPEVAKERQN